MRSRQKAMSGEGGLDTNGDSSGNAPAFGADISNCDREPIHIPGSIQPHGALLAIDPEDLQILQAGGDTGRMLGAEPIELLGQNLSDCVAGDRISRLRTLLHTEGSLIRPVHAFGIIGKHDEMTIDTFVYRSGSHVVLELEPILEESPEDTLAMVQTMLARVQEAESTHAFCQALAVEMHRVSGFDRVMVYRFLQDDSGCVEAESRSEGMESFLGLHYPASDIPRQARQLYLTNWLRLIPDARYTPAPILAMDDTRNAEPLDLSHSRIRSVSPMHLAYLANMGVVASMSLSIVLGGRLWGLIACHHREPRFISHRLRMACELFAQMASSRLETKVGAEEFEAQLRSKRIHEDLVTHMSGVAGMAEGLTRYRPNLLDYIPAEGVGLWLDDHYTRLGCTPRKKQVAALVAWLNETVTAGVFHTDRLPLLYPPAAEFADVASGLIALSVSKMPRDYVLWFRPEALRTVIWAGDPNKPVETVNGGQHISPRKSFAAWKESVQLHSHPWRSVDVEAAKILRLSLMEVILRRIDQLSREREEARSKQEALSAELDRRLEQWQAVAAELKEEARQRALVETELSQVLRSTVEEQEAERRRIARELHDSLGQTLTLLQLGLDNLGHTLPESDRISRQLSALKALANSFGSEVNRLAWEIRPTALDDLGLETAIRHLVETWGERLNMQFDLRLPSIERRLDPTVETTLYRVVQEAITNIAKHAEATRVAVLLEANEKEVRLIIEDNGRGFSPGERDQHGAPARRLGLLGIRERLSLVSGTLEVESSPGHGCTLFIVVPL
ncbi:multi-sensor signal transduction histidine kinase [Rhodomicrobium vannielii ATCC 17100]|uniref:Multi-sensor signal transduction histidine kinase n=2 Tax=Rhodomicrobium vannielii TaxID=1069 RepID=E3I7B2_RHOVT|nr:multi-sensor signal transduction histidine kinase [Rhodomicrobium vannielii ATCC 17100]